MIALKHQQDLHSIKTKYSSPKCSFSHSNTRINITQAKSHSGIQAFIFCLWKKKVFILVAQLNTLTFVMPMDGYLVSEGPGSMFDSQTVLTVFCRCLRGFALMNHNNHAVTLARKTYKFIQKKNKVVVSIVLATNYVFSLAKYDQYNDWLKVN